MRMHNIKIEDVIECAIGTSINEFSTDTTLSGNSDDVVPTEKTVRTYVDNHTLTESDITDLDKYTQAEVDGLITTISGKLDDHNELNNLDYASSGHTGFASEALLTTTSGNLQTNIDGKSDTGHDHTESDITDLDKYTQAQVDTISGSLSDEIDNDITTLSGALQNNINTKSDIGHTHTSSNITDWQEAVDDSVNALLVGGDNITLTYDDGANTLTISGSAGEIDHGALTGLGDDDHSLYIPVDASRGFTATVSGIDPTEGYHLTTKDYVDTQVGMVKSGSQTISSGTNTVSVNFGSPFDDISYIVNASIRNTIDSPSEQYSLTLTTKATTGFTFTLSAVVDTANFYLEWVASKGGSAAGNYIESNEMILSVSGTWKGRTLQIVVDDASTVFGDALYCASDFHYERADADAEATMPCAFIACGNGTGTMEGLYDGQICDTVWNWSAGYIYVSTTTGKLTQTTVSGSGDINQIIGRALSADTILVNTTFDMVEV